MPDAPKVWYYQDTPIKSMGRKALIELLTETLESKEKLEKEVWQLRKLSIWVALENGSDADIKAQVIHNPGRVT